METKIFAKGINFKRADNTPNWIIGKLSIKADEAIEFIKSNSKNGWVNLDIKESYKDKSKFYCELNTWEATGAKQESPKSNVNSTDLPF